VFPPLNTAEDSKGQVFPPLDTAEDSVKLKCFLHLILRKTKAQVSPRLDTAEDLKLKYHPQKPLLYR